MIAVRSMETCDKICVPCDTVKGYMGVFGHVLMNIDKMTSMIYYIC